MFVTRLFWINTRSSADTQTEKIVAQSSIPIVIIRMSGKKYSNLSKIVKQT